MVRALIGLLCCLSTVSGQGVDPCSTYTLLNQPQRSIYNNNTIDLCDRLLTTGWYRFHNADIPFDQCIPQYHCGTHVPLWIQGGRPSVVDGMVLRKACGDINSNDNTCCDYQTDVAVKNCHTYLVYYLQPVSGCSMAYCTNETQMCFGAKYSNTGFPPCIDAYPTLTHSPTLSGPVLTSTDYQFTCLIQYPLNKQDAIFEVTWLIDGKTSIHTETLTGDRRMATISGEALEGHLNSELSCSVVSSFADQHTGGLKSPAIQSAGYWVGIKYSKPRVRLDQKSLQQQVSVQSTIPIVCRQSAQKNCHLILQLTTSNEKISTSTCTLTLAPTDWNPVTSTAQTTFTVGTEPSIPLTSSSVSTIHIDVTDKPGKEWNNYHMPYIQISTVSHKPGAQCSSTGDPHYRSFDNKKRIITNLHVGQYTLVRQKSGTFKVETRTWKHPGGKASFNCAVAAREGNDVITVDMCNGKWGKTYPKLEIKNPSMFENKTEIVKDPSGNSFLIKFRSGAVVSVRKGKLSFINVFVTVPGTFMNDTEGICGNFDGNPDNDLHRSTGQTDTYTREPYAFIESWSVPTGTSLFEKAEPLPVTHRQQNYCTCTSLSTRHQCNPIPKTTPTITDLCTGCQPVSPAPGTLPSPLPTVGMTTTSPSVSTVDYTFPAPSEQPQAVPFISKPDATRHCMDVLDKYPSAKTCINNIYQLEFTEIVNMCVTDIELTGDIDMGLSALLTLMEGCGFKALIDPKNVVNGTFMMPPEAKICPGACSGNGDCQNGICTCAHGFEGPDCSIKFAQPPVLTEISGGGACDTRSGDCYRPVVLGENMKENSTMCTIGRILDSGFGSSTVDVAVINAAFMSTHHVKCPFQKDPYSGDTFALQGYMISLRNSVGRSKEYMYTIYDSKCMECDDHNTCSVKHDACMIGNKCYTSGETDDLDHQGRCVPTVSNTKWTKQAPTTAPTAAPATAPTTAPTAAPTAAPTTAPNAAPTTHASTSTIATSGIGSTSHYTAVGTGCGCYFDPSNNDCACCKNYGCPCDANNKHVCYDCMNPAMCSSTP